MTSKRVRLGEMFERLNIRHFKKSYGADGSTITYQQSGEIVTRVRETEKAAFLDASGKEKLEPDPSPFDKPDKYRERRPCTCKNHQGNKWRPVSEFSVRKTKNGKMYPQSWCRACCAEYARQQYQNALRNFP